MMRKKPKIISDKLKNKIIRDIWRLETFWFWKRKKKEEAKNDNTIIDICRAFHNERKRTKGRKKKV